MGLDYIFVKDGNNLEKLIEAFKKVKNVNHPIVVHICTQKGKGYKLAEIYKEPWHYTMPFNIENGKPLNIDDSEDYTDITKEYLIKKMKENKTIVTITSGTPGAVGFNKKDRDEVGSQFIDVGIAEETAVAIASGMASKGAKPVYTVVSTFLQRTYDQLSQDLCINNNPATIVVYYAGAIGMTDVTHLGWFDIAMMGNIPNLVYLAPTTPATLSSESIVYNSGKTLTSETEPILIPVIFQCRMTDYYGAGDDGTGRIGGTTTKSNLVYSKTIGVDLLLKNVPDLFSFDITIEMQYTKTTTV